MVYHTFILPHLQYGSILFDSANKTYFSKLDRIDYRMGLLVSGCVHRTSTNKVLGCLGWMSLQARRSEKKIILVYDFPIKPTFLN
jgi:hypothetical protein